MEEIHMKKYEKPSVEELNLDEMSLFTGCSSYADDDDSCYAGDDDND